MYKILAIALLAFGFIACGGNERSKQNGNNSSVKRVKVIRAQKTTVARTIPVSGTLAAEEEIALSMKVAGRVANVFVDLGSPVKRGQPLVRLEPADFQLRVQQAEAAYQQARVRLGLDPTGSDSGDDLNPQETGVVRQAKAVLEEAKLTRDRMESLNKEGLIPKSQLDDAIAQYQVADARYQDALEEVRSRQALLIQRRAELGIARKQLADSTLLAPGEGIIQEKRVSPGQFVDSGDPVLTMVRVHPLRLKLHVPERDAPNVHIGQRVDVRVEGDSRIYEGRIARVAPAISADNRTLMVEAEVANDHELLRPGSFARADIVTESKDPVVLVPDSSVVTFAGLTKVFAVENNETKEKKVKVRKSANGSLEILEGIEEGESIIVTPGTVASGEKVIPIY